MSRWRLRRTRARMDFEWCFGTFVPCFGGQTTKGGQEPAKHGIDHTPDPVAMQWPCLPEHKLRTLRTRSVRRASGLVQTAIPETCPLRSRLAGSIYGNATYHSRSVLLEGRSVPCPAQLPNFRIARHPAAIRTGTSTTWLHRWAMYSRMSSGPSWSVERWKYCANYTPMSSEHGCERLSHDQPIVFSRP